MRTLLFGVIVVVCSSTAAVAGPSAYIANFGDFFLGGGNSVSVIDTATNTVTATVTVGSRPQGVAISPDATRVYVGSTDTNFVTVIDATTNTVLTTINVGGGTNTLAVTPDGTRVYAAGGSSSVKVINAVTNTLAGFVFGPGVINVPIGVALLPNGSKAYVTNNVTEKVAVINTATNTMITSIDGANRPVVAHPDGTRVYAGLDTSPRQIIVIDTATDTVSTTIPLVGEPWGLAVHPDGSRLYVASGANSVIIDTATNLITATTDLSGGNYYGITVHPDGDRVYMAESNNPGTVHVLDATTMASIDAITVGNMSIAYGPFIAPPVICGDGQRVYPEDCDDGNTDNGDCCSSTCTFETGSCDDDDACTTADTCDGAGTCVGGAPPNCNDNDLCTQDSCDSGIGCVNDESPAGGCRLAEKSILLVKTAAGKEKIIWKWIKGAQTMQSELGDPTSATDYALCVYSGATASNVAAVPWSASLWSPISDKGYLYKDGGSADGVEKILLKGGDPSKAKALVKSKGSGIPVPPLPFTLPVIVQLVSSDGDACFEATYNSAIKETPTQFKAKQ